MVACRRRAILSSLSVTLGASASKAKSHSARHRVSRACLLHIKCGLRFHFSGGNFLSVAVPCLGTPGWRVVSGEQFPAENQHSIWRSTLLERISHGLGAGFPLLEGDNFPGYISGDSCRRSRDTDLRRRDFIEFDQQADVVATDRLRRADILLIISLAFCPAYLWRLHQHWQAGSNFYCRTNSHFDDRSDIVSAFRRAAGSPRSLD